MNVIVCADKKGGIGYKNQIPWNIYVDQVYFNNVTTKCKKNKMNAVIMGRKTWESIGKKLDGRLNVVISSNNISGADVTMKSLRDAHEFLLKQEYIDEIFIIGGSGLYKEISENPHLIRKYYYNEIQKEYLCDTFVKLPALFPALFPLETYQYEVSDGKEKVKVFFKTYVHPSLYQVFEKSTHPENQYIKLLEKLVKQSMRETRNGKTSSCFNKQLCFDMEDGFPLLTTKRISFQHVVEELLWFLKGETNSKLLEQKGVNIWKKNSSSEFLNKMNLNYQEGDIGPMYGFQLVHFGEEYQGMDKKYQGYNQIKYVLDLIQNDPTSRRIMMTTFNPKQAKEGVLYPCHGIVTQFYVEDDKVHLSTYQRSADVFLGLPWNIASYSLLLHIICHLTNKKPGKVHITLGDYHLYEEHVEKAIVQILRSKLEMYPFPTLKMKHFNSIEELDATYFEIENYQSFKTLVAEMKA